MRYFYLVLVVAVQYLCLRSLKFLDNPAGVAGIPVFMLFAGLLIYRGSKDRWLKDIGWGVLYGGVAGLILLFLFIIWLATHFPR